LPIRAHTILRPTDSDTGPITAGDVLLVSNLFLFSRTIQGFQRVRYGLFAWPSHAAIVDSHRGDLIEVSRQGVIRTNSRNYSHLHRAYLHPGALLPTWDAGSAVQFARHCADGHMSSDRRLYLLNAIALLTGVQAPVRVHGVPTCAGFVAAALEAGGFSIGKSTLYTTPADLAARFRVN
jgi:hypothetical protein